ncbi:MAG: hypothetical protein H7145_12235 [Akkermansiaceae bacterium]|nr:hypothetical protein [Armatimonadota bacterium]
MATTRFWGTVTSVRARLTLAKFESETHPTSDGHYLRISGTRTSGANPPEPGTFLVAVGPKAHEEKRFAVGDLVRGDGDPVPETNRDVCADLYRARTVHVLARAKDQNMLRPPDPPRTDAPLTPEAATKAARRLLDPANLDQSGFCEPCPYGTMVAVVRLSDPRDLRRGIWSKVPACLGPADCPHYRKP